LVKVLESRLAFGRMACLCQYEVGQRLCASPGSKEYGSLTLMAQARAEVTLLKRVLPGAFTPPPKVDSALVLFERLPKLRVPVQSEAMLTKVIRTSFGKRRKTLRNGLIMAPGAPWSAEQVDQALAEAKVAPGVRGETLGLEAFARIADGLSNQGIEQLG
jgi:16S rRNA (adenine1518-N6/adenine1519-N6)-dimethyltransferase